LKSVTPFLSYIPGTRQKYLIRENFSISAFVKSERPNQFPGLTIRYVRGADPIIKLLNDNREVVETLGIDKWNTDSVEAFFKERLRK